MVVAIISFGLLVMAAGLIMITNPAMIGRTLRTVAARPGIHIAAVLVRLVLGVLLIRLADASKFPLVVAVLGWIAVIAAIVLAVIGRRRFIAVLRWAISLANPYVQLAGACAAGFGAFLAYAFI